MAHDDMANAPAAPLPFIDVAGATTTPSAPPRFVWSQYLPRRGVTLLGAHGGTGKSTIALMLCIAVALGRPLFGIGTEQASTLFVSLEDDAENVRWQLGRICMLWGINSEQLRESLRIIDGTSAPELYTTEMHETPTYVQVQRAAQGTGLVVVDNASDAYGGDEIQRRSVRAFVRSLARMARESDSAVLLLAHVDKNTARAGKAEGGQGYSGSTAWNNSARSRLFLSRQEDGTLLLEHQKSNRSAMLAEPLRLAWPKDGLPEAVEDGARAGEQEEQIAALLRLIDDFTERGEYVSVSTSSHTNAFRLLRGEPTYPQGLGGRQLWPLLRQAERAGLLTRVSYKTPQRKTRERWQVTAEGRALIRTDCANRANVHDGAVGAVGAPCVS